MVNLCAKIGRFLGQKYVVKENLLGAKPPDPLSSPLSPGSWLPEIFPARNAPGNGPSLQEKLCSYILPSESQKHEKRHGVRGKFPELVMERCALGLVKQ